MNDTESIVKAVHHFVLDQFRGINSRITQINNGKAATDIGDYGKNIVLTPIDSRAVFFLTMNYMVPSFDTILGITIVNEEHDEMGGCTLQIGIKIATVDKADGTVDIRATRYYQALKNMLMEFRHIDFNGLVFSKMTALESQIALDPQAGRHWREVGVSLSQYFPEW